MVKKRLNQFIFSIGLVSLLAGCGSYATELRKEGFDFMQKGFAAIEPSPELYEVVEIKNVKVFIVG